MESTPATRTRSSSLTVQGVDTEDKKVDIEPVVDVEKLEDAIPVQNSPLEEEEFPEGGRGWLVVLGAAIYASLVLGWP